MGRFCGTVLRIVTLVLIGLSMAGSLAFAGDRPAVIGVRAADHDGITRFVLDLSASVSFQVSAEAGSIIVDLSDVDWTAETKGLSRAVGLLRNFHFEQPSVGSPRLVLDVTRPVLVQKAFIIPPSASNSYRLVFDLVPGSGAKAAAPLPAAHPSTTPPSATPPSATPPSTTPSSAAKAAPPQAPSAGVVPSANPLLTPADGGARVLRHPDGEAMAGGPMPAAAHLTPPEPAVIPAALPTAPAPAAPARPLDRKTAHAGLPIVVVDPGHGGVDPGATSLSGAYEKNIVLALARDVKAQLDKAGKVKCVLTRDRDVFIPLRERVAIGRAANADLFMSLHADTVADPEIRGLSVYTLSQTASDAEAEALADKENKADIVAGIDLSNETPEVTNILIDLVQRESMNLSAVFAHQLIGEVAHDTHQLLQNTHRFAGFAVLKAPDVPSVLVETGYLSNEKDEQMLRRPEYRAKLATAMARAIEHYFALTKKARHP